MKDTSVSAEDRYRRLMLKKSPQERIRTAAGLFDFSRKLVASSLRDQTPGLSATELRKQIFLRFYGADFDPRSKETILKHFENI